MIGEIHLKEPLGSLLDIESHLFSSRTADFYRGFDLSDGSTLSFWLFRAELNADQQSKFISRLAKIDNLRLPNCPIRGYGVDPDGKAFVIFPAIDASAIVSGATVLDTREAERRFVPCLQTLERLHAAGVVLGDIGSSSFVIDRGGRILFVGVMGDCPDLENLSSDAEIAADTLQYLAPEQRGHFRNLLTSGNAGRIVEASLASDVFAIGVLGYRIFGGKFPFGFSSAQQFLNSELDKQNVIPVSSLSASAPAWCDEVFLKCLHDNPHVRYHDASEISYAIQTLRQKVIYEAETPLVLNKQIGAGEKKTKPKNEGATTFEHLGRGRHAAEGVESERFSYEKARKISAILLAAIISVSLFFIYLKRDRAQAPELNEISDTQEDNQVEIADNQKEKLKILQQAGKDPKIIEAMEFISKADTSESDKSIKVQELVNSDDPIAHEALILAAVETTQADFRDYLHKAISDRVKRLGGSRSAEQLKQWVRTITGSLPEDYEAILKVVNPQQPLKAQESLLRQVYPRNARFALRFAAAITLDSKDATQYQPILSQLFGDALNLSDSAQRSPFALILADPETTEIFNEDLLARKSEIPDSDLTWVLAKLAARNDNNVRQFAELSLEKGQLSPVKRIFLDVINERDDLPLEIIISLVRAGADTITSEDIAQFGGWVDAASEKVLLALCVSIKEPKLLSEAFETLAAKTLTISPALEIVEAIRSKYWDQRVTLAPLVAVASIPSLIEPSAITDQLSKLDAYISDPKFIELFASSKDPVLSKAILEKFSKSLGLGALLKFIASSDKDVRIQAVQSLKRFNDVGTLKLVLIQYDKEKDEEVRKVYRDSFWMIAERESKKQYSPDLAQ